MPDVSNIRPSAPGPAPGSSTAATKPPAAPAEPDRVQRGFGAGLIAGGSVEAGLVRGFGATASAGVGAFADRTGRVHAGAFAGGGAFSSLGDRIQRSAPSSEPTSVAGAFAGAGIGAFVTNAACADDLRGVAQVYSLNLGVGPLKVSVGVGAANGTYVGAVTVGPGIGLDASRYPTQSAARQW